MRHVPIVVLLALLLMPALCYGQETPTPTTTETPTITATATATETPTPTMTRIPTVEIRFSDLITNTTDLMQQAAESGEPSSPLSTLFYAFGSMIAGFGTIAVIGFIIWRRN